MVIHYQLLCRRGGALDSLHASERRFPLSVDDCDVGHNRLAATFQVRETRGGIHEDACTLIHTHTQARTFIHLQMHMCTQTCTFTHTHASTCVCVCVFMCVFMCVRSCIHTQAHVCVHVCVNVCTFMHTHTSTCSHVVLLCTYVVQDDMRERSLAQRERTFVVQDDMCTCSHVVLLCPLLFPAEWPFSIIVIKRRLLSESSRGTSFDFGCCFRLVFAATKIFLFHKCGFGLQQVERTETNIVFFFRNATNICWHPNQNFKSSG